MPSSSKPVRLDSLTSLRYFAALGVVITHVDPTFITQQVLEHSASYGYVGVSFFYLLSGFVLTWSCANQRAAQFWWYRFSRIWPLMIVLMAITYGFLSSLERVPGVFGYVLQAFLVQGWDPNPNVYAGGDGVVWSLSCEMFFYTMFPLLIVAIRRMRARGLLVTAVATVATMITIPLLVSGHVSKPTYVWLFFYLPGYRIGEFIIGMLLARAVRLGLRIRPGVGYTLGVAGLIAYFWVLGYLGTYTAVLIPRPFIDLLVVPFSALLVLSGASADLGGRGRALNIRFAVLLGLWSYALYLVHDPLFAFAYSRGWFQNLGGLADLGALLAFIAVATAASALAHHLVERPAERFLRARYRVRPDSARHRRREGFAPAAGLAVEQASSGLRPGTG